MTSIKTGTRLIPIKSRGGDFAIEQLAGAVNNPSRNEFVVQSFKNYATDRKATLAFAVDVQHVLDLTATFQKHGINAASLTSLDGSTDRKELLDLFRQGRIPVLVNCGILTEGTDLPIVDCVLLARPTMSNTLLQQMIGRGR